MRNNTKRTKFIKRERWILEHARGKSVLDIGCTGMYGNGDLHKEIASVARRLVGIDINRSGVKKLRSEGYDVKIADAQHFDLNLKFSLVVASEVLEHLPNPGYALRCIKGHLMKEGKLLITVPNARSMVEFFGWFNHRAAGHVILFDHQLLENLLNHYGFQVVEKIYTDSREASLKGRLISMLMPHHSWQIGVIAKATKYK